MTELPDIKKDLVRIQIQLNLLSTIMYYETTLSKDEFSSKLKEIYSELTNLETSAREILSDIEASL